MIYKLTIAIVIYFSATAFAADICENPITTIEVNNCLTLKMGKAEKVLNEYFAESQYSNADKPEVFAAISNSQKAWLQYREAHCGAIYEMYKEGTIRGAMYGDCMLKLTYARTHELWQTYLTYMDSTPPILPEPERPHNHTTKAEGN